MRSLLSTAHFAEPHSGEDQAPTSTECWPLSPVLYRRREFLKRASLASAATLLTPDWGFIADSLLIPPKVVHVHHGRAARWSRSGGNYRDFIDQGAVTLMLDQAVLSLKGGTLNQAWGSVFSLAAAETRLLGIKVNCNNATAAADGAGTSIDAVPEPVIAVIKAFLRSGGRATNCYVFDLSTSGGYRYIATWFRNKVLAAVPGVQFRDAASNTRGAYNAATHVTWSAGYPTTPPVTRIHDLPRQCDYLVNMPIVKRHIGAGSTLGYKNHFGTIENCAGLHNYVYSDVTQASVLADIMGSPVVPGNPAIRSLAQKTVLTIGDMLYAQPCKNFGLSPEPWVTFGREWPNNLIVATDPVAADSVMIDLLEAEPAGGTCGGISPWTRRYLQFAEAKGQGIYEHIALPVGQVFNPARMTYTRFGYRHLDLWPGGANLTVKKNTDGSTRLEWTHYFVGNCEVQRATKPDFSDKVVIALNALGYCTDTSGIAPAYYRVNYVG